MARRKKKSKGESVVVGRWKSCLNCSMRWIVCISCDRRRRYCSDECRSLVRKRRRRVAVAKYSRTEKGKKNQRSRQRKYRQKLKKMPSVTDHRQSTKSISIVKSDGYQQKRVVRNMSGCCLLCEKGPLFLPSVSGGATVLGSIPTPQALTWALKALVAALEHTRAKHLPEVSGVYCLSVLILIRSPHNPNINCRVQEKLRQKCPTLDCRFSMSVNT